MYLCLSSPLKLERRWKADQATLDTAYDFESKIRRFASGVRVRSVTEMAVVSEMIWNIVTLRM
jgi:hypothetical protein